jgi:hypothetical protein
MMDNYASPRVSMTEAFCRKNKNKSTTTTEKSSTTAKSQTAGASRVEIRASPAPKRPNNLPSGATALLTASSASNYVMYSGQLVASMEE